MWIERSAFTHPSDIAHMSASVSDTRPNTGGA
jgi:hypothetical protein